MNKGGFSWNRLLGISAAKSKLSRQIGIPLTRSGHQQKIGRMVMGKGCLITFFFAMAPLLIFAIGSDTVKVKTQPTKVDFNFIFNGILAACALIVAILSYKSYRKTVEIQEENIQSRRAYFAPDETPGFFRNKNIPPVDTCIYVKLNNYGINPASKVEYKIFGIGKVRDKKAPQIEKITITIVNESSNPIPGKSSIHTKLTLEELRESAITELDLTETHYVVLLLKYKDEILNSEFKDIYFWSTGVEGELLEANNETRQKLNELQVVRNFTTN